MKVKHQQLLITLSEQPVAQFRYRLRWPRACSQGPTRTELPTRWCNETLAISWRLSRTNCCIWGSLAFQSGHTQRCRASGSALYRPSPPLWLVRRPATAPHSSLGLTPPASAVCLSRFQSRFGLSPGAQENELIGRLRAGHIIAFCLPLTIAEAQVGQPFNMCEHPLADTLQMVGEAR